jgi:hypothetical protein
MTDLVIIDGAVETRETANRNIKFADGGAISHNSGTIKVNGVVMSIESYVAAMMEAPKFDENGKPLRIRSKNG